MSLENTTTWYKAKNELGGPTITPVEVSHETKHFVTINGERRAKKTSSFIYEGYFPSWQEAYEGLHLHLTRKVEAAERAYERKLSELRALEKQRNG